MSSSYSKLVAIFLFGAFSSAPLHAQEQTIPREDKDFRVEFEPASILLKGFAGSCTYNVTRWNDFNVGLYGASLTLPTWIQRNMFNNIGDTTDIRLGVELAVMARYKLNVFKTRESNPYVGMILGWEYFDISQPNASTVRITTGIATPYIGFEFYVYKQMLYINPQLRGVYYFGTQTSDTSRPETLVDCYLLPQVSLGVRF